MKQDLQKAQRIFQRAGRRVCLECGLRNDWATFITVTMAAVSVTIATVIRSDDLMKDGGEKQIRHTVDSFEKMLREDVAKRIEEDQAQTRQ